MRRQMAGQLHPQRGSRHQFPPDLASLTQELGSVGAVPDLAAAGGLLGGSLLGGGLGRLDPHALREGRAGQRGSVHYNPTQAGCSRRGRRSGRQNEDMVAALRSPIHPSCCACLTPRLEAVICMVACIL